MKKLMIATSLLLLVAATAVAGVGDDRLFVQPNATFAAGAPATTDPYSSCDIGAAVPAATLLLPYFEVEVNETRNTARTTLFTLVNTTAFPQIAHIVVWTDWSYPVLDFNIFLTGYDVQGINLYDIIVSGPAGVPAIPQTTFTESTSAIGARSATTNPDWVAGVSTACANLPGNIPADIATAVRSALTTGIYAFPPGSPVTTACGSTPVGGNHPDVARGYVTIDVARTCSQSLGIDFNYYLNEIAFDNALTGDWIITNPDPTAQFAGGNPLVHIPAIPGGTIGAADAAGVPTNLPFTFYDRYVEQDAPGIDRRVPLPGLFAARFIDDPGSGFDTDLIIWREGTRDASACAEVVDNSRIALTETVRFDEAENPTVRAAAAVPISPVIGADQPFLNEASSTDVEDLTIFPPFFSTAAASRNGWMYLNLNNGGSAEFGDERDDVLPDTHPGRSQNWVSVRMEAVNPGQFSVLFDATHIGNGCSADPGVTTTTRPSTLGATPASPAGID
ncbi:MAG: hypothetical protein ACRD2J_17920 [Thermoanaerobaculia bacterium]